MVKIFWLLPDRNIGLLGLAIKIILLDKGKTTPKGKTKIIRTASFASKGGAIVYFSEAR